MRGRRMMFTSNMPTSALQLSEIAKQQQEEERKQQVKEARKMEYEARMQQLSQDAVNEAKKVMKLPKIIKYWPKRALKLRQKAKCYR